MKVRTVAEARDNIVYLAGELVAVVSDLEVGDDQGWDSAADIIKELYQEVFDAGIEAPSR